MWAFLKFPGKVKNSGPREPFRVCWVVLPCRCVVEIHVCCAVVVRLAAICYEAWLSLLHGSFSRVTSNGERAFFGEGNEPAMRISLNLSKPSSVYDV